MKLEQLIGEATEYDKKAMLEIKKPKSWLKSVSAFANGVGGVLIFGIADNDSVVGRVKDITCSGVQTLYIKPDSAFAIKSVSGFIYYMDSDSSTNKPGLIINNIALTRYHEPVDTMTVAGKDSLAVERRVGTDSVVTEKKADSIQSVDIRKNVPARMNPREMKENNAADHSHSDRPQRIKRRN